MTNYIRVIETSNEREFNEYVQNGWELIDTSKGATYEGDNMHSSYIKYALGLPSKEHVKQLQGIIEEYEKRGLKEILFEKVAEETGDNLDEYENTGVVPSKSPLAKYMTNYENIVHNKDASYYSKKTNAKYMPDYDPYTDEL